MRGVDNECFKVNETIAIHTLDAALMERLYAKYAG